MAKTMRITYSTTPMATWVRAVIRIPMTEMMTITTTRPVAMAMLGHLLLAGELKTARTDGPSAVTGVSVPNSVPASISQPVMKPRYGLIARPTHSKDAPQLAFHRFSLRYAFAMTSIGIAVSMSTAGPV